MDTLFSSHRTDRPLHIADVLMTLDGVLRDLDNEAERVLLDGDLCGFIGKLHQQAELIAGMPATLEDFEAAGGCVPEALGYAALSLGFHASQALKEGMPIGRAMLVPANARTEDASILETLAAHFWEESYGQNKLAV